MPNVNSGKEWSEMDLADLQQCVALGESVDKIADYLCRDRDEVAAKIAALQLR
jgi:hypothetical protein